MVRWDRVMRRDRVMRWGLSGEVGTGDRVVRRDRVMRWGLSDEVGIE